VGINHGSDHLWKFFLRVSSSSALVLKFEVEDSQIPIVSADLAAEDLAKTNALTYLRLEGYGHDKEIMCLEFCPSTVIACLSTGSCDLLLGLIFFLYVL